MCLATGASTPHEILCLINTYGIDLFDLSWAKPAADHGVTLDFRFPLWSENWVCGFAQRSAALNLYDTHFATDCPGTLWVGFVQLGMSTQLEMPLSGLQDTFTSSCLFRPFPHIVLLL